MALTNITNSPVKQKKTNQKSDDDAPSSRASSRRASTGRAKKKEVNYADASDDDSIPFEKGRSKKERSKNKDKLANKTSKEKKAKKISDSDDEWSEDEAGMSANGRRSNGRRGNGGKKGPRNAAVTETGTAAKAAAKRGKRKRDSDEEGNDEEETSGTTKKGKSWQSKLFNLHAAESLAIGIFDENVSEWRGGGIAAVKPHISAVCTAWWMNDSIRVFIEGKNNTIKSALDLQAIMESKCSLKSKDTWFGRFFTKVKKPSAKMMSALKTEAEGRGPFRGLSAEDTQAAKDSIMAWIAEHKSEQRKKKSKKN